MVQASDARNTRRPVVRAVGVEKTYKTPRHDVPVLRGVDIALNAGEVVAVTGPSGCGKTTLLNCLAGLDTVDAGRVEIDGVDIARLDDEERSTHRAGRMGFIFQHSNLLPILTAFENVELPLRIAGWSRRDAAGRAHQILDVVGLGSRLEHLPAELSGGEQQRCALARALAPGPRILWADEPTGSLDEGNGQLVLGLLMAQSRAAGVATMVVTHDAKVAAQCDRHVRMAAGRISADAGGSPSP